MPTIGYVLSHTHWDREWYLTFQQVRMRLVNLMDRLIPYLEEHPEFTHFHLDGQTICLEDYLEVRPEMESRIKALVQQGRIGIGPWYVLPDLMCIGQESVLRNLCRGISIAERFGSCTPVGYLPDIFSHTSQMPQIFSQLGFRAAVVWRGAAAKNELPYEVLWRSPDGTELLTLHLPDDRGYLNAFPLSDTSEEVSRQFEQWITKRLPHSPSGQLLLMNGCDQQEPNYRLPEFLRDFNRTHPDCQLKQISLREYLDALQVDLHALTVIEGEQSSTNLSPGRNLNPSLKQTMSSRIPQKIENYQCETLLVRYAEPLSALLTGAGLPTNQHFLDLAWKYLLQNHPHDSICGCSNDDVHRDMARRFAWVREIGTQYVDEAMAKLGATVDTSGAEDGEIPVHLFRLRPADASAGVRVFTLRLPAGTFLRELEVHTADGMPLQSQILRVWQEGYLSHPFDRDPSWKDCTMVEAAVWVPAVPAMGLATLYCRPTLIPRQLPLQAKAPLHLLENEFLQVKINQNGTLDVLDKTNQQYYAGLHVWTDEPDIGDEYIFSPTHAQPVWNSVTQAPTLTMVEGPLVSKAILAWTEQRSDGTVHLETTVELRKGSPLLQFHTAITNQARNHRIRLHFPTDLQCSCSFADSHFDIVRHPVHLWQPTPEAWVETETGCQSQKRFVYLEDAHRRLTFLSRGLVEYEVVQGDAGQDLTVTCLRCVGCIGTSHALTTFAPPGPNAVYTEESQLIGTWNLDYALLVGTPADDLQSQAEDYHSPCCFLQDTPHSAAAVQYRPEQSLLQCNNPEFVISSMQGTAPNTLLIRGCNLSDREQVVTITLRPILKAAWTADPAGKHPAPVAHTEHQLSFLAPSRRICTFLLEI